MLFFPVNFAVFSSPHGYESVTSEPSLPVLTGQRPVTGLSETSTWELVKFRHLVDAISFFDDFIVLKTDLVSALGGLHESLPYGRRANICLLAPGRCDECHQLRVILT